MSLYKKHVTTKVDGEPARFTPGDINYEWCCDCSLRHTTQYSIETDEDGKPVIVQYAWRDDYATNMRRAELRREARAKKARTK